jgi:hypothetical protein
MPFLDEFPDVTVVCDLGLPLPQFILAYMESLISLIDENTKAFA